MPNPILDFSAFLVTYLLFGAVGYPLARRVKRPVATITWVILCLSIVTLGFSGRGEIWLFAVDGFHIYLVNAVQAVVIGLFTGLLVREVRSRRKEIPAR